MCAGKGQYVSVWSYKPERKSCASANIIPSLTLRCCSLLPASRVGGCQVGWALLVLWRLHHGRHNHLLPRCGRVCRVTMILILERWGWKNWFIEFFYIVLLSAVFYCSNKIMLVVCSTCVWTECINCCRGAPHLPLSEIAAPLSSSAEHLPAQSSECALYPELPSCRCTAAAPAGWGAQGKPGLDPDPETGPGPGPPWRPTGPLDDAQTDPETQEPKLCSLCFKPLHCSSLVQILIQLLCGDNLQLFLNVL